MALAWHTIRNHLDPKFMVKGFELAQALVGPDSRFAVIEVRAMISDPTTLAGYHMGVHYRVRDAHTVSDAEVKAGVSPRVVGTFVTLAEALAFCEKEAA